MRRVRTLAWAVVGGEKVEDRLRKGVEFGVVNGGIVGGRHGGTGVEQRSAAPLLGGLEKQNSPRTGGVVDRT